MKRIFIGVNIFEKFLSDENSVINDILKKRMFFEFLLVNLYCVMISVIYMNNNEWIIIVMNLDLKIVYFNIVFNEIMIN